MGDYGAEDAVCAAADVAEGYVCYVEFGLFAVLSAFRRIESRDGGERQGIWARTKAYRMPKTFLLIILSITLRNRQSIINIIQEHAVVRDIAHETATTTAC